MKHTGPHCITLALFAAVLLCTPGCKGCRDDDPQSQAAKKQEKDKEKKKKKKKRFEIGPLRPLVDAEVLPKEEDMARGPSAGLQSNKSKARRRPWVKPGHWTGTTQKMLFNREDFVGQSVMAAADMRGDPIPLPHTGFTMESVRPVALAKGRTKLVESALLVPNHSGSLQVRASLQSRGAFNAKITHQTDLRKMPSYQYHILVLASEPSRYAFLKVFDSVRAPWEEDMAQTPDAHYRVVMADTADRIPIASSLLTWTSVAYVVWDEVDPTVLTVDQRDCLMDWLHWGGRLIINGPDSLDSLGGSFLEPYLPCVQDGSREVTEADLADLNAKWNSRKWGKTVESISIKEPWSVLKLRARDPGLEVPSTSGLFYERHVGRGSILVSAVQLAQRDLLNWKGYDGFLNGLILRRPARRFEPGPHIGLRVRWEDQDKGRLDARYTTGLRLASRDAGAETDWHREEFVAENVQFGFNPVAIHIALTVGIAFKW